MATSDYDKAKRKRHDSGRIDRVLANRIARIDDLQDRVRQKERCFRETLIEVLQEPPRKRRRTPARWLFDWVYSDRDHIEPAGYCCDHCDPELADLVRAGAYVPGTSPSRGKPTQTQSKRWCPAVNLFSRPRRKPRAPARWRRKVRRTLLLAGGLIALLIAAPLAVDLAQQIVREFEKSEAADIFNNYVVSRSYRYDFVNPHVRPHDGYYIACGRAEHHHSQALCLLIHPGHDQHQVSGTYRRNGGRHYDCTGQARRQLRVCRAK